MSTAPLLRRDPAPAPQGLLDAHVHVGPSTDPAADPGPRPDRHPASGPVDAAAMTALLTAAGTARALACPVQADHYAVPNAALRRACASAGDVLAPAARLGGRVPVLVPAAWAVRRSLRSRAVPRAADADDLDGLAAVTLAPHVDGVPGEEVLAQVRARALPVLVHAGAFCRPRWVARELLPRLGACPVVLSHLGAFPASAPDLADAVALAREGRVWLETSAAWLAEFVALAVRQAPGRVLFGSGAPLIAPEVSWRHVAAAVTDDGALAHVATGAAAEVFGW